MEPQEYPSLPPLEEPEAPPTYSGGYMKDLFFLLLLTAIAGSLVYILGGFYLKYYYGGDVEEKGVTWIIARFKNDLTGLRIFQMLNTLGIFLFPPLAYALFCRVRPVSFLRLNAVPPTRDAWMLPGMVLSFFPILAVMYFFNQQLVLPPFLSGLEKTLLEMEEQSNQFIEAMLKTKQPVVLAFNLLLVAVLPAFCEEIFFRGTIQRILFGKIRDMHLAILFTALLFSFFHFQFYGFLPRMALGMMFGYLFWWSGSLWTPILAHLINNAWQVYAAYLYYNGTTELNIDETEMLPFTTTALSTGVFLLLCYLYYNAARLQQMMAKNDE